MRRARQSGWLVGYWLVLAVGLTSCGGDNGPTSTPGTNVTLGATLGGASATPTTLVGPTTSGTGGLTAASAAAVASPTVSAPTALSTNSLNVVKTDELDLPTDSGDNILSPDGKMIVINKETELCLYTISDRKQNCVKPKARIEQSSLNWSPDSRQLVFTDAFLQALLESDVWVMDAASGKLSDLTDDGIEGVLKPNEAARSATIDVAPTWTSDSKQIIFVRYDSINASTKPALYRINTTGGSPTKLGDLTTGPQAYATANLSLAMNGKQLAYNVINSKNDQANNGVWLSDVSGGNAKQLLKTATQGDTPIALIKSLPAAFISFASDSRYVLAETSPELIGQFAATWDYSSCRVVGLDGQEVAVDGDNAAQWAGWSSIGSALVYIVHDGTPELRNGTKKAGLYVVAAPGGHGRSTLAGDFYAPYHLSQRGLVWANNNSTLAVSRTLSSEKLVILHLGQQ